MAHYRASLATQAGDYCGAKDIRRQEEQAMRLAYHASFDVPRLFLSNQQGYLVWKKTRLTIGEIMRHADLYSEFVDSYYDIPWDARPVGSYDAFDFAIVVGACKTREQKRIADLCKNKLHVLPFDKDELAHRKAIKAATKAWRKQIKRENGQTGFFCC